MRASLGFQGAMCILSDTITPLVAKEVGSVNTAHEPLALRLHKELRKETLQSQKLRAYLTGGKIAFVSALWSALVPKLIDQAYLLAVPALAAIFLDFIVNGYSFSIKRIGTYCRHYLEPLLRRDEQWPDGTPQWEKFMARSDVKQRLATVGQLGFTGIAVVAASVSICWYWDQYAAWAIAFLAVLFALDVYSYMMPRLLEKRISKQAQEVCAAEANQQSPMT